MKYLYMGYNVVIIEPTNNEPKKRVKKMSKTVTVTYEINIEEMSKERIEDLIFQSLDIGFSWPADMVDLQIEGVE